MISVSLTSVLFATYCTDLMAMVTNPPELSTFEPDFDDFQNINSFFFHFNILHISRYNNVCANRLTKQTRA